MAISVIFGTFHFVINSCLKKVLILERFLGNWGNDWDLFVVNLEMMENWGWGIFFWEGMTGVEMTGIRRVVWWYENERKYDWWEYGLVRKKCLRKHYYIYYSSHQK